MGPQPRPGAYDDEIGRGIAATEARNEVELLAMPMPTLTTGEDVRRQQLQMSIDQDIHQELFQASLQRDVELGLTSNPGQKFPVLLLATVMTCNDNLIAWPLLATPTCFP